MVVLLLLFTTSLWAKDCSIHESSITPQQKCETITVSYFPGSPLERAERQGKMLAQGITRDQVLEYFSYKLLRTLGLEHKSWAIWLNNLWARVYLRNMNPLMREELRVLAESSGKGIDYFNRAIVLPDTGAMIHGLSRISWLKKLMGFGCTSAAESSPNHGFTMARNLDFSGVGVWDKMPSIGVHLPTDSGELKHLTLAADGIFFGGITGINQAGLALVVHQNYTSARSTYGEPIVLIGEQVLRRARTLAEAIEILRQHRPGPVWTFLVSELKTGKSASIESSQDFFFIRTNASQGIAQTNHIHSPEIRPYELLSVGADYNSPLRLQTADRLLRSQKKPPIKKLAEILSYQSRSDGQLSLHDDIIKAHTIQSVIFEQTKGEIQIYVAFEEAPTSSGRYLRFKLKDFWSGLPLKYEIMNLSETPPAKRAQQILFTHAFTKYYDYGDPEGAVEVLRHQKSPSALLFKAVAMLEVNKFAEAYAFAKEGHNLRELATQPRHLREALQWVELLALYFKDPKKAENEAARALVDNPPNNSKLRKLLTKISQGKNLWPWETRVGFDFFNGSMTTLFL